MLAVILAVDLQSSFLRLLNTLALTRCVCAQVWLFSWSTCSIMYHSCQSHTGSCQSLRPRLRPPLPGGTSARKCATLAVSDAASSGTVLAVHLPLWHILLPAMIQSSTENCFRACQGCLKQSSSLAAARLDEPVQTKKTAWFHSVHLGVALLAPLQHRLRRESQNQAALDLKTDLQRH